MKKVRSTLIICITVAALGGCRRAQVPDHQQAGLPVQSAITPQSKTLRSNPVMPLRLTAKRITAAQAVFKAKQFMKEPEWQNWQIAFVSNTGFSQSVRGEESRGADGGLMHKDGAAAQWVVEIFRNSPKPYSEDGRKGKSYPFQVLRVTAKEVSALPSSELAVPTALTALKPIYLRKLDAARKRAVQHVAVHFDGLSVISDVKSDGSCSWRFRFYESQDIVAKVRISGDGERLMQW